MSFRVRLAVAAILAALVTAGMVAWNLAVTPQEGEVVTVTRLDP